MNYKNFTQLLTQVVVTSIVAVTLVSVVTPKSSLAWDEYDDKKDNCGSCHDSDGHGH